MMFRNALMIVEVYQMDACTKTALIQPLTALVRINILVSAILITWKGKFAGKDFEISKGDCNLVFRGKFQHTLLGGWEQNSAMCFQEQ